MQSPTFRKIYSHGRTWKYALDAVQGLHNDGDLVDVDHAVVVNIIQLEGPVNLLSICTTQLYQ